MPRLVASFCDTLAVRGYSPAPISRYHVSRALFHHRQPNGRPLTFRSQTAPLVALRQFYRWLARAHRVLVNPTAELELPRVPRWQPRSAMSVSEVEDVLSQPDLNIPDGLRDQAILEVFYSTGIRAAELAGLQVFDLDVARGALAINAGKGGRSRVVPSPNAPSRGVRSGSWTPGRSCRSRPITTGCSSTTVAGACLRKS